MKKILILILLLPTFLNAQENPLDIFKPLENHIWSAEGNWGDGSRFKQEIELSFSLENTLITVESKGFTDKEQTQFGVRNHGIRQYDEKADEIRFWEFDVFGGLTKGTVKGEGKNLIYTYDYGGTLVTEMWIFKDERTYDFIVGIYENGAWKQQFLQTEFKGEKK